MTNLNEPKLIIFDVDGTMLNTEFVWQSAWKKAAEIYNVPRFGEIFPLAVGSTGVTINNLLDRELPDIENRYDILQTARKIGIELLQTEMQVMPGLLELLDWVDSHHIQKAIATTTSREATEERLKRLNLFDRFPIVICGDEVKNRKPDPEIYLNVLKQSNINAADALVIEDTDVGVEAAFRAEIPVIMVPSINPAGYREREYSVCVVNSLNEVKLLLETIETN